jgi:hypothetical protein
VPSGADVAFITCLLGLLSGGSARLSEDGDAARHLTVGELILRSGRIPDRDVFSHTMSGKPFVPYEWLAEVASAVAYRGAGLGGTLLLHGTVVAVTFAVLFWHLRARGHAIPLCLGVTMLAASAATLHWLARPHVFTFLGVAVFGALLDGWYAGRLSRRWLWLLPPVVVLWANLHGGFLVGLLLIGVYGAADVLRWLAAPPPAAAAARRRLRALALPAAVTFLAVCLNPAGLALPGHLVGYFGKTALVNWTEEYRSPDFHTLGPRPFLLMVLATLVGAGWSRRRLALQEGLVLVGTLAGALYSVRNVPLFAVLTAPALVSQLAALPFDAVAEGRCGRWLRALRTWWLDICDIWAEIEGRARGHVWSAVALAVLVLVAGAQLRAGAPPLGAQFDPTRLPVDAVTYLRGRPPAGNGFNRLAWGGYLLNTLWPAQRVFIDGQTDFYGEDLFDEYLTVEQLGQGWEAVLDRYAVRWVLYDTDSVLIRRLEVTPGWQVAYQDDVATVLIRTAR